MASTLVKAEPITDISATFRERGTVDIGDLRDLVIPVPRSLTCEAYFDSPYETSGSRLIVSVNEEEVIDLRYDGSSGRTQGIVDISDRISVGENELRVRCLVSCSPVDGQSDSGVLWLRGGEATVIRKKFTTRGSLEPFDLRWVLVAS